MARGGSRQGAGRKPGAITQAARKIAEEGLDGLTPLDYLLGRMRDDALDHETRTDAAKAAAPYVHARLAAVEANIKAQISLGDILDAAD